jgi:phosphate transport system substrate-binding protein
MSKRFALLASAIVASGAAALGFGPEKTHIDPAIKDYKSVSGVSGNLNSVGSDTLNNCMTYWGEGFKKLYPNVNIQVEGKGSSTAPTALIAGTAQLGPMSRPMKSSEIAEFERKYGYKPTEIKVAIDALAVFVHKDNPVKSLTLTQVDSVFSSTNKRGGTPINTWGELGLQGDWAGKRITLYGRNSASGTYAFFKEHALNNGDYRTSVNEQAGSSAVVTSVAGDLGGIGYSGIGYATSSVRAVPLAGSDGTAYEPSYENALNGTYPLARFLYVYVNKKPGEPLDTLTAEFIRYVCSKQGQMDVEKDQYFPLPAPVCADMMKAIQ